MSIPLLDYWITKAKVAEARVAELEALFDDMEANGLLKRPWRETVGDETPSQGVHEREAD